MTVTQKKIYLFANWKMYLDYAESIALANLIKQHRAAVPADCSMVIFPTALALPAVAEIIAPTVSAGAQNLHWLEKGGSTGEISAGMFKSAGAAYALVGHSERRHLFHETNHDVRQKLEASLAAGLTPVLCVGETLAERDADLAVEVLETQLRSAFTGLSWPASRPLIIAYEPVWAISRGAAPEEAGIHCDESQAEEMHVIIADFVKALVPSVTPIILFGGSVRPNSAGGYLAQEHIDGVLVGAAATKIDSWLGIIAATNKIIF